MQPDPDLEPPDLTVTAVWIAAAAIAILALRGTFLLAVVPGVAVALATVTLGLALAAHVSVLLYDRLQSRLPARQLLWMVPLLNLTASFAALALPLAYPTWAGDPELWRDLTGLPPTPFTRLVTTLFMLVGIQVAYLFFRLLGRYLSDPRSWTGEPRDGLTSLVFAAGLVILACTLLYGQAHRPQNVAYLRGWVALGMAQRPADALRHFQDVVERYPESGLADSCLYRMARIETDEMGHPAEAAAHLDRLLTRFPASPFADDALHDLGELRLGPLADPAGAIAAFTQLRTRFPRSYLTERAALGHARALARSNRAPEATALLADLERAPHRPRIVREDPDGALIVEPLTLAVQTIRKSLASPK